ncbi:MAG: hypothetical protein U0230_25445 [Polyangiales bacterium]
MRLHVDAFPIVVTTTSEPCTGTDYVTHMEEFHEFATARGEPFVHVWDLRGLRTFPDAETRQRVVRWMVENADNASERLVGAALVVGSPIVRSAFSLITWLADPPIPLLFHGRPEPALHWAAARLEASGLEVTDEVFEIAERTLYAAGRMRAAS